VFAKELVDELARHQAQHSFDHLVVVAAPRFLGELRAQLPTRVARTVLRTVSRDFSTTLDRDLPAALAPHLEGTVIP
jgi:protein required for attachment to host cells